MMIKDSTKYISNRPKNTKVTAMKFYYSLIHCDERKELKHLYGTSLYKIISERFTDLPFT